MSVTITYFNPDTNIVSYTNTGPAINVVPEIRVDSGSTPILFWGQVFALSTGAGTFTLNLFNGSGTNISQADQLTWGGQLTFLTTPNPNDLGAGGPDEGYTFITVAPTFTVMPSTQTATITSVSIATPGVISYTATSASTVIRVYKNGSQVSATNSSISIGSGTITLPAGVSAAPADTFQLYQIVNGTPVAASNVYTIAAPNPSATSLTINSIAVGTNTVDAWSNHAYSYAAVAVIQRRAGAGTVTSAQFTVATGTNIIYLLNAADNQPITLESGDTVTISSTAAYGSVAVASTYTMPTPSGTSVVITAVDTSGSPAIVTYTFTSAVFTSITARIYKTDIGAPICVDGTTNASPSNPPQIFTINVGSNNTLTVNHTFTNGDNINFVATSTYGEDSVSAPYTVSVAAPPPSPPSPPGSTSVVINSVNLAASPSPLLNYTFTSATYASIQANLTINGAVFAPLGTPSIYTLHVGTADTMAPIGLTGGDVLQFIATADYGGSAVSAPYTIPGGAPAPAVPCVCAGTMIRTARGERAVETLAAGDFVLTADGREVAIKGIYTTEIAACTGRNAPYVVAAGAFGRGLPSADLTISPGHALMARPGQWMIPCHTTDPKLRAKMSRYANGQEVTYYHVELPNYLQDTFVANGVVSEAYGLNWAKTYKGPSVYTQMSNGYFTRAGGAVARTHKAAAARK